MRAARMLLTLAVVAAAMPAAVRAQDAAPRRVLTGLEFRSLSFGAGLGTKSVSELVLPVGLVWAPSSRLSVDLGTRFARASRSDEAGATATITGLTDTQVRASFALRPDVAVLTLAANLPTGKASLSAEELAVAGAIASDLIPFPVSSFGSGFNVTTGIAVAVPVSGWAVGVGGSYRMSSAFEPLADTGLSYKAGGEVRLRVGLDRLVGQGRVALGFTYSSFATDEFGGSEVFRPGPRYIGQAAFSVPVGNLGLSLYAWDLYRTAGSVPASQVSTDKQNVLTVGAGATVTRGRNVLRPSVEFRRHTQGAASLEPAGTMLSFGARYQMVLTERLTIVPALRFDTGNIANNGTDVSYTGFSVALTARSAW